MLKISKRGFLNPWKPSSAPPALLAVSLLPDVHE